LDNPDFSLIPSFSREVATLNKKRRTYAPQQHGWQSDGSTHYPLLRQTTHAHSHHEKQSCSLKQTTHYKYKTFPVSSSQLYHIVFYIHSALKTLHYIRLMAFFSRTIWLSQSGEWKRN